MVPPNELTASDFVKSFNGKVTHIKDVHHYPKHNKNTFTLEHCHGRCGKDIEFFEEWLVPDYEESEAADAP